MTEYERYLRTEELLALQKGPTERVCHDELAFQVVHQVEELWMKLALAELDRVPPLLDADRLIEAREIFQRVHVLMGLMGDQMRVLEAMSPRAYFTVRTALGRGSGQESPGFNALLACPPPLRASLKAALKRRGVKLLDLHRDPSAHPDLYGLTEAMVDFDEGFQRFRYRHLALVRRIIGGRTPSLKGAPAELLEHGVKQVFFPELWLVREALFRDFVPGPSLDGADDDPGGAH
ncbi:MAG: tryptophan 2,3-dioxygenase [Myxococcales bacterium]|nr:tryptophan 2,3-dioxygenase [Myxococcales bacterium]MCB9526423.1 tryptophan 2,3-dioxygenase [Myxococcales bacterium]